MCINDSTDTKKWLKKWICSACVQWDSESISLLENFVEFFEAPSFFKIHIIFISKIISYE